MESPRDRNNGTSARGVGGVGKERERKRAVYTIHGSISRVLLDKSIDANETTRFRSDRQTDAVT